MKRPRSCWKCATDTPHPFSHWHIWCRWCGLPKMYRGPSCKSCHGRLKSLADEILKEIQP